VKIGPNIKKLAIQKMSREAIPKGGGIIDGINFLKNPKKMAKTFKESVYWARATCLALRQAGEPNPFKNADDEIIAGEILRRLKKDENP